MDFTSFYLAFHDPIWITLLSVTLFFPVRQLIWVLYVRKKQKTQQSVSEEEKNILKKKATFTSILLCIVFSYLYVNQVFS
jgi:hypothetical protein